MYISYNIKKIVQKSKKKGELLESNLSKTESSGRSGSHVRNPVASVGLLALMRPLAALESGSLLRVRGAKCKGQKLLPLESEIVLG
jgi:hypothetical protein